MKKILLSLMTLLSAFGSIAFSREVRGTVLDTEGQPVADVVVSDGRNTTKTDRNGIYRIDAAEASRFIFISTPSGYLSTPRNPEEATCFYHELAVSNDRYDFVLRKNPQDDNDHNIVVIADPQVLDQEDLGLMDQRLAKIRPDIEKMKGKYTFGICLGDIVCNDHALYPQYQKELDQLGLDFRHVLGNHDMTLYSARTHEGSMTKYENFFGPSWYSFNVGDVHYVVMNNNFYIGRDWFYIGYLDEVQMAWLEKDLSYVPKDKRVTVCLHIPTTLSKEDRERFTYSNISEIQTNKHPLYALLAPYESLILSGHIHTCTTENISEHLTEINVGGFCGAWWCGDVCIDGAPAGYKFMEMNGKEARWSYIGCGDPADYQMKVYVNDATHPGETIVNVWDYDDKWKVEYFENGKKVCDMERFTCQDPHAVQLFHDPSKYKISWVYAAENRNFFKAPLSANARKIEVRVTDRFGRIYSETLKVKK